MFLEMVTASSFVGCCVGCLPLQPLRRPFKAIWRLMRLLRLPAAHHIIRGNSTLRGGALSPPLRDTILMSLVHVTVIPGHLQWRWRCSRKASQIGRKWRADQPLNGKLILLHLEPSGTQFGKKQMQKAWAKLRGPVALPLGGWWRRRMSDTHSRASTTWNLHLQEARIQV